MDELRAALPFLLDTLADVPLPPLSEEADETLRRARVFLFGVSQAGFWTRAALQGYTPQTHSIGVLHFRMLSAEYPFDQWREWRALRPMHDPDLPELVDQLAAFRDRWLPRALAAVSVLPDEGDRAEVTYLVGEEEVRPSRTWTAKAFVQRLRGMQGVELYRPVWDALVAQGLEGELPAFDRALADVQEFIRWIPVDEVEISEIDDAREDAARTLAAWLDDRRRELAPALDEADLRVLGLGDLVPPPFDGPSAFLLGEIEIPAKA